MRLAGRKLIQMPRLGLHRWRREIPEWDSKRDFWCHCVSPVVFSLFLENYGALRERCKCPTEPIFRQRRQAAVDLTKHWVRLVALGE